MKVCVYGLVKNKEDFCISWFNSIKDADTIIVGDLGSTDSTKKILKNFGVKVFDLKINPFRYDIARNTLLSLIPADIDIAISYDLNQIISENWKTVLYSEWLPGTDRLSCLYKSHDQQNTQSLNIIHSLNGYIWEKPIYSQLKDKFSEKIIISDKIIVSDIIENNICDSENLLDFALKEMPNDTQLQWHYACSFLRKNPQLEHTFNLCRNAISISDIEKSNDAFKYIDSNDSDVKKIVKLFKKIATESNSEFYKCEAMMQLAYILPADTYIWLIKASAAAPWYWKPHFELAKYFYRNRDWYSHLSMSLKTLNLIKLQPNNSVLGYLHNYICIAAWNCNLRELSFEHAKFAGKLLPNDIKVQQVLHKIEQGIDIDKINLE